MIQVFGALKSLLKSKRVTIDHSVFRLHYKFTVLLLLVCCIVVTTKQYGGEPIKCTRNSKDYSDVVESYCLITTTYTMKSAYNITVADKIPHPGIAKADNRKDYIYHKYYQWVGFVLFIQAVLFYFPHWLWKTIEECKVEWILNGIDAKSFSKDEIMLRRDMVMDYLKRSWGSYNWYAIKYCFCEFLCFINVICQMYALDVFFDGEFWTYGLEVVNFLNSGYETRIDPMTRIFPRVTSCSFRYFGDTGKLAKITVLCILPINVINEKIFVFLWFWFVILAVISILAGIFRVTTFSIPALRVLMLQARFRHVNLEHFKFLVIKGSLGDWFLLHLLAENVDDIHFRNFVSELSIKLRTVKSA